MNLSAQKACKMAPVSIKDIEARGSGTLRQENCETRQCGQIP